MTQQSIFSSGLVYLRKNPGVHTIASLAEVLNCTSSTAGRIFGAAAEMGLCVRKDKSTYICRAPEMTEALLSEPAPEPRPKSPLIFRPIEEEPAGLFPPDDEYPPPFKVKIYDHFIARNGGSTWFVAKDEHGKKWHMKERDYD